jgi:hypothetical protein
MRNRIEVFMSGLHLVMVLNVGFPLATNEPAMAKAFDPTNSPSPITTGRDAPNIIRFG